MVNSLRNAASRESVKEDFVIAYPFEVRTRFNVAISNGLMAAMILTIYLIMISQSILYYIICTEEMIPTEVFYLILFAVILLASPLLPTPLLLLLDNIVIRIAIVCLLLYLLRFGSTVPIIAFIAIAALFLERNRRKVAEALKKLDAMEVPTFADVDEAYEKTMPVDVPSFSTPNGEDADFIPQDNGETNIFEPVDTTINQKAVLSTIYPLDERTDELYEKMGFGHVDGVHTME